eukprot:5083499-Ditylum_brightwellii.AAC.1
MLIHHIILESVHCKFKKDSSQRQSFSKEFLEGYQSGMRTGDKALGMACLTSNVIMIHMTGKPLKVIEEQCQASITQM